MTAPESANLAHCTMLRPRYQDGVDWVRNEYTETAVYRLDPAVEIDGGETTEHVIVTSTLVPHEGPLAVVLPADQLGRLVSWEELGKHLGQRSHRRALESIGYTVAARTIQEW